jgi:DNA-binding transcriptional MerR regulator
VPRRAVIRYYKRGLVSPAVNPAHGYYFDRDGIRRLRRIEALRPRCCDTLASIKIILSLMDEVERLNAQIFSRPQAVDGKSQSGSSTRDKKT